MSKIVFGNRDLECLNFLHAHKVAASKQIHREIFKSDYDNFLKRMNQLERLNLVERVAGIKEYSFSNVYTLSTKGFNLLRKYKRSVIAHNQYKSNVLLHDLTLVEIRKILTKKQSVTDYFTENQIQNYSDFNNDEELTPFKNLHCDAMFTLCKNGKESINIAIEFELSGQSNSKYNKKLQRYYLEEPIHAVFYICDNKQIENRIKKVDSILRNPDLSKIYFIQFSELIKEENVIGFTKKNNKLISVF